MGVINREELYKVRKFLTEGDADVVLVKLFIGDIPS
jgi:hypothetical protein